MALGQDLKGRSVRLDRRDEHKMLPATTGLFNSNPEENGKPHLPALTVIHAKFRMFIVHIGELEEIK